MKLILNEEQQRHYDSIKWLNDPLRGKGKIALIAYVAVEDVIEKRGQWVGFLDHPDCDGSVIRNEINRLFALWCEEDGLSLRLAFDFSRKLIKAIDTK